MTNRRAAAIRAVRFSRFPHCVLGWAQGGQKSAKGAVPTTVVFRIPTGLNTENGWAQGGQYCPPKPHTIPLRVKPVP